MIDCGTSMSHRMGYLLFISQAFTEINPMGFGAHIKVFWLQIQSFKRLELLALLLGNIILENWIVIKEKHRSDCRRYLLSLDVIGLSAKKKD